MSQERLEGNVGEREAPNRSSREGDTPFLNKSARAAAAKETINHLIPKILSSNTTARNGIRGAQLLRGRIDLPKIDAALPPLGQDKTQIENSLSVKLVWGSTLSTARALRTEHAHSKIAVLNMASPLQPGGGVLRGAKAQEEGLCVCTTLYPSLRHEWYRLPDDAVAYTPDVLVFRDESPQLEMLATDARFYVDVVSCAAVRMPDLVEMEVDGEMLRNYADPKDEELMVLKIKYIMRTAVKMGVKILVLGALGCGAYKNPIHSVARMMRRCLLDTRDRRGTNEDWRSAGIEQVVIAILDGTPDKRVWTGFEKEFGKYDEVEIQGQNGATSKDMG